VTNGNICRLSRERFEVTLLRFPSVEDDLTHRLRASGITHDVLLSTNLHQARAQVAALELDVLVFTEIGMDFNSYFLAFSRLALRSIQFWGHAVTSGIETMDYFVTSKHFQSLEDTKQKYSECVYRMKGLTTVFPKPKQRFQKSFKTEDGSFAGLTRQSLDLPSRLSSIMFLVPQTLYKLHPDFDVLLNKILSRVPNSFVVFPQGDKKALVEQIKQRFRKNLSPQVYNRVHFVRKLHSDEFIDLCAMANGGVFCSL
jgi:protein O-GlcNAc transferase